MKQGEALSRLRELDTPFLNTDIATILRLSANAANKAASRLAKRNLLVHLTRWSLGSQRQNQSAVHAQYLAAPYPANSRCNCTFHYGMISQIPQIVYAVTVAKPTGGRLALELSRCIKSLPTSFLDTNRWVTVYKSPPQKNPCWTFFTLVLSGRDCFRDFRNSNCRARFSRKKLRSMMGKITDPRRRRLVEAAGEQLRQRWGM
jgi:hypothetical protein